MSSADSESYIADYLTEDSLRARDRIGYLERLCSGYERIFEDNLLPTLVCDTDSLTIQDANESALLLYRASREQLLRRRLAELFAPAEGFPLAALREVIAGPVSVLGPYRHLRPDGQLLTVRLVALASDPAAEQLRVAIIQDEAGRHTADDALRLSEQRYRELFENASDVIFLHDLHGMLLAVNRAAEVITGFERDEIIGRPFYELIAPDARQRVQDSISAHLGGSAAQHYELPIVSKRGTRRFLEVSTRIAYRRGQQIGIQGLGRDVTERKMALQQLERSALELRAKNEELTTALRLAQEATQLKEQFLANTSHELRTPMNGIMGMITLLKGTPLDETQQDYADVVIQCANDLLTIINDLLDMSQIEANRMPLTMDGVNLQESVRSVLTLLSTRASAKNLSLEYHLDPALPTHIHGDSVRFRQVLTNLVANAIKFTSTGSVLTKFNLATAGNAVRCEVKDTGIGVESGLETRIFEAFFQADGTLKRRYGGTGLGLAISKQLVGLMGGTIGTYNNKPEPGATFWFELPLKLPV